MECVGHVIWMDPEKGVSQIKFIWEASKDSESMETQQVLHDKISADCNNMETNGRKCLQIVRVAVSRLTRDSHVPKEPIEE